ncbi:MAG: NADH-quinone oxidoreductase subunit NuoE [Anaerolineae bacterium]|nr:NADH-quinone oxidoreductase subunit NuoE [Anaerolineae bacterium]
MSVAIQEKQILCQNARDVARAAVERHGATREELISILTDVNEELGYIPAEALEEISSLLQSPRSQILSVASFYRMLSTKPKGQHVILFCGSAPCHVVGGRELREAIQSELGLEPGETSADGRWTLEATSCLGLCSVGPVIIIDGDIYGNVTPEQLPDILARYE